MATRVKRGCVVCQACEHPNWAIKGRYEMTPIPPAPFISVCVDIFSLPEVNWQENTYDALVLCVDRHSGWMIAHHPCIKVSQRKNVPIFNWMEDGPNLAFHPPSPQTKDHNLLVSSSSTCVRDAVSWSHSHIHTTLRLTEGPK